VFDDMPQSNMRVSGVTTIDPERTFWDKVIILHGLRRWHDVRGQLRHQGHRVSRHYYHIYTFICASRVMRVDPGSGAGVTVVVCLPGSSLCHPGPSVCHPGLRAGVHLQSPSPHLPRNTLSYEALLYSA